MAIAQGSFRSRSLLAGTVVAVLLAGCAAIPPQLRDGNPQLPGSCGDRRDDSASVHPALVSFEMLASPTGTADVYLDIVDPQGKRFLLHLVPRVFGRGRKEPQVGRMMPTRRYCYLMGAGDHRIRKAHVFIYFNRTINGTTTTDTIWHVLPFSASLRVSSDSVAYLGRLTLLDSAVVGKGYFEVVPIAFKRLFKGLLSPSNLVDERFGLIRSDDLFVDEGWFRAEYPAYGGIPIGGAYREELDTTAPPP